MKVLGPLTPPPQRLRDVPCSRCTQLEGAGGSHPPCRKGIAEDATEMKTFRFCASGGLGVCISHQLPGETQAARSQPPLEQRGLSLSFRLQVMLPWSWRLLRATAQLPPQREACAVASVEGQELEPPRLILALSLTCSPLPSLTQLPFLEREPWRLFGCCLPTPPSRTTHSQASLVSGHRTTFLPRWSPAPPGQALQGRLLFPPRKKVEISQPQARRASEPSQPPKEKASQGCPVNEAGPGEVQPGRKAAFSRLGVSERPGSSSSGAAGCGVGTESLVEGMAASQPEQVSACLVLTTHTAASGASPTSKGARWSQKPRNDPLALSPDPWACC